MHFLGLAAYGRRHGMTDVEHTNPVPLGNRLGLDKITITALAAGVINLIGGTTAVKGWLLDLGLRYYDALAEGFGLPSGSFIPDEKRLIATGYSVVLDSSAGIGVIVFILPTLLIYIALGYAFARIVWERARSKTGIISTWLQVDEAVSKLLLGLLALGLVAALSYGLYQAVYQVPLNAAAEGASVVSEIKGKMIKDPGCASCVLYGPNNVAGLPIFADGKAIFVANAEGGVSRVAVELLTVRKRFLAKSTIESRKGRQ